MSRLALAAALALGLATAAQAQTAGTSAQSNGSVIAPNAVSQQPGVAATSSGAGNVGTGASSDVLGTGNTQGNGVMSPQAPATGGHGATGANPNNSGGYDNNK